MGGATMAKSSKPKSENGKLDALEELSKELPLFSDTDYATDVKSIPSGSIALDMAIGVGGYPRGSIVDVFGGESAGKSLLSIMAIAQVQKQGGLAVVWDAERSYSKNMNWMRVNGVDTSKLKFLKLRPTEGCELGFDAVEKICKAGVVDLIVIDSIPSLVPQAALDREIMEHEILGRRAAKVGQACARLVGLLDESKTTVMFINQIRANIVSGPAAAFAPKTKETTNFSLRHFSSLRLQVSKISKPKMVNGLPYSHRVKVVAVKNKVSSPYRTAEFDICYTKGVDTVAEVADILIGSDEAKKAGAWISWDGNKYQGRDGFVEGLRDSKVFDKAFKQAMSLTDKVNLFGVVDDKDDDSVTVEEVDQ